MSSTNDGKSKQTRKGPAPFASFEDVAEDVKAKSSSPESKPTCSLPQIDESGTQVENIETKEVESETEKNIIKAENNLKTPSTPRIDISRASSSSHHDSRDSSPEMALFAGKEKEQSNLVLGFKEDGALDLRSSTEELSFFEPNTAASEIEVPKSPSRKSSLNFKIEDKNQCQIRKDSQTSDIGLLGISGRSSRVSSIGSQSSAHSNISVQSNLSHISLHSHVSHISGRLSTISGVSRSPSPHKMLLETSFCGPKPIETEVDLSNHVSKENLLELSQTQAVDESLIENVTLKTSENKIEVIVETHAEKSEVTLLDAISNKEIKSQKQISNALIVKDPRVGKKIRKYQGSSNIKNESKDIIRIKLKPDHMYDDDDDDSEKTITNADCVQKPATLNLNNQNKKSPHYYRGVVDISDTKEKEISKPTEKLAIQRLTPRASPSSSRKNSKKESESRTPSPAAAPSSRKSSFCSLFKSKETILSPDSPLTGTRRKSRTNSAESTRSRSKSREKSTTPTSTSKIKGSVLSLFKSNRNSNHPSAANSRDTSPVIQALPTTSKPYAIHIEPTSGEKLKYYDDSKDGIIHIPLHTPPEDKVGTSKQSNNSINASKQANECSSIKKTNNPGLVKKSIPVKPPQVPKKEEALPQGIIIIPLHSPTEKKKDDSLNFQENAAADHTKETKKDNLMSPTCEIKNIEPLGKQVIPSSFPDNLISCTTDTIVSSSENIKKNKEHVIFSTSVKVGSKEQLFSTQLSITKTPSLTSDNSDSYNISADLDARQIVSGVTLVSLPETHIGVVDDVPEPPKIIKVSKKTFTSNIDSYYSNECDHKDIFPSTSVEDLPSSESELNTEMKKTDLQTFIDGHLKFDEIEKKGLVVQDSFEDELPYVPTTLPQERSVALPIIPIRERQNSGLVMHPIDRPRSTTPIHPSSLDEYCSDEPRTPDNLKSEKLKILLPEKGKPLTRRLKSPRRSSNPKNWEEFAEKGIAVSLTRRSSTKCSVNLDEDEKPELPPRAPVPKNQWINFEDVSERKKMPKRIETIPGHGSEDDVCHYVNPEECQCECHESGKSNIEREEDEQPLLKEVESDGRFTSSTKRVSKPDRRSIISTSDDNSPELVVTKHRRKTKKQPFKGDLDVRSNRSSFMSEDSSVEATSPQADISHY